MQGAEAKTTKTGGARKRRAAAVACGRSSPALAQEPDATTLADATLPASAPAPALHRADSTQDAPTCTGGDAGTDGGGQGTGDDGARAAVGRPDLQGKPACAATAKNKPPQALVKPKGGHNGAGSNGRATQPRTGNSLAGLFRRVQ